MHRAARVRHAVYDTAVDNMPAPAAPDSFVNFCHALEEIATTEGGMPMRKALLQRLVQDTLTKTNDRAEKRSKLLALLNLLLPASSTTMRKSAPTPKSLKSVWVRVLRNNRMPQIDNHQAITEIEVRCPLSLSLSSSISTECTVPPPPRVGVTRSRNGRRALRSGRFSQWCTILPATRGAS